MEKNGEVDAWVMALPNGACKPFVDAIDRGSRAKREMQWEGKAAEKGAVEQQSGSVIVDLSADYRFEKGWTYGLPGKRLSL